MNESESKTSSAVPLAINELCRASYQAAVNAGWHSEDAEPGTRADLDQRTGRHMLMVTEIAEATEEIRAKKPALYFNLHDGSVYAVTPTADGINFANVMLADQGIDMSKLKPEGEAVELVDMLIRFADYFGKYSWDAEALAKLKMAFNATRGQRHGGKAL